MRGPTSVGMAEGKAGLGSGELVEVVQPDHVRHLKLCLSRVREQQLQETDRQTDRAGAPAKETNKTPLHFNHCLQSRLLFHLPRPQRKTVEKTKEQSLFLEISSLPQGHGPFPDRHGLRCTT